MSDSARLLEAAREAVLDASIVCRTVQRAMGDDRFRALLKEDRSPVTIADLASQAVVAHALRERLGPMVLVGEETSAFLRNPENGDVLDATLECAREVWPGATERTLIDAVDAGAGDTDHAAFWTLDPIDGTKGFLRGEQYAVALAYIERGEPVIAALSCPNLPSDFAAPFDEPHPHGCLYLAIRGDGVYERPAARVRGARDTRVSRVDHEPGSRIVVCASVERSHSSVSDTSRVLDSLPEPRGLVRIDSQCKYAVVARGQADAYLRMPTRADYVERIWDHAAGALVATEAGAFVTDIEGRVLDFSRGRGLERNRGIVCAPPRVHGLLIGAIRRLRGA